MNLCGVCGERVGCNSLQCTKSQRWVLRLCSDVPRQVSLLSCWDVFVYRGCLGYSCSIEEKLEFKRVEDVLEEVENFCHAVSTRIGSAWKKFRELRSVLVGKQGLSLKQEEIFINDVLDQFCCTLAKRENLLLRMTRGCVGVKRHMNSMMCGVRMADRVSTNVLCDSVVVVMKIDDKIIQSRLRCFGHVICIDIDSQIREVMEVETTGKRKKGRPRKSWEECMKKDLERYGLRREDTYYRKKWRERIRAKIALWITELKRTLFVCCLYECNKLFNFDFGVLHKFIKVRTIRNVAAYKIELY